MNRNFIVFALTSSVVSGAGSARVLELLHRGTPNTITWRSFWPRFPPKGDFFSSLVALLASWRIYTFVLISGEKKAKDIGWLDGMTGRWMEEEETDLN